MRTGRCNYSRSELVDEKEIDPPDFKLGGHWSARLRSDACVCLMGMLLILSANFDGNKLSEVGLIEGERVRTVRPAARRIPL